MVLPPPLRSVPTVSTAARHHILFSDKTTLSHPDPVLLLQVTVTLLGTEGESEPHHLTDPDKPVFERGAVDTFVLTTPFSLGELQSIRLWHDNSGRHPAW